MVVLCAVAIEGAVRRTTSMEATIVLDFMSLTPLHSQVTTQSTMTGAGRQPPGNRAQPPAFTRQNPVLNTGIS